LKINKMLVIPVINEIYFSEVLKKIKIATQFSRWLHFDIADGKFTAHRTWGSPEELERLKIENCKLKIDFEVHLMVENPEALIKDWLAAGAKRIIVHLEKFNLSKFNFDRDFFDREIGLAINPETPVKKLIPYLDKIKFVQILAVQPGLGGQKFQSVVLEKIKFLKKSYSDVIIEVDGGVNLENAKLIKEAGADILAAGSYIFKNSKPEKAYQELTLI